jgi:hypothetical protein
MIATDLRELDKAARKWTPPSGWYVEEDEDGYWSVNVRGDGQKYALHNHVTFGPLEETHRLIAATRNALPYLLDVVDSARLARLTLSDFGQAVRIGVGLDGPPATAIRLGGALDALDAHLRGEQ